MADEVLQQGVRGITDLMVMPGLINLDFADVRSVMGEMGKAMMGTGEAEGENRAIEAAEKAIANPLLDGVSMRGAKGVIVSITGGEDMRLMEVDEAASHIKELVDPDANIIWGSAFNNNLDGKIRVSVVATGIEADASQMPEPARVFAFPPTRTERPVAAVTPEPLVIAPPTPVVIEEPEIAQVEADVPSFLRAETDIAVEADPAMVADETAEASLEWVEEPAAEDETVLELSPVEEEADELVLATEDTPVEAPIVYGADAPVEDTRPSWMINAASAEPEKAAPRIATAGGTLFERMSNIARGAAKAGTDQGTDPLDIPRFLNRQNNQ
jgi:cell division protein FtsZ